MVRKERVYLNGVPLILALPEQRRGWVLFLHGAGGSKERTALLAAPFHSHGLATVHPDAPLHGERAEERWRFDPKDRPNYLEGVVRTIVAQVAELPALAANLAARAEFSGLPMHAAGASMGGYVWHELISRELLRPRAFAALITSAFPLEAPPEVVRDHPAWQAAHTHPPTSRASAYPPTPVLHLHGARDPVVPPEQMLRTMKALSAAYKERDGRLAHVVFEGVGHELPEAMLEQAASWLAFWSR